MTGASALLTLLRTGDSAFPSGAFAFSGGLETLCEDGLLADAGAFETVLLDQLAPRWLAFDRVFLAAAHGAGPDLDRVCAIDADCEAHQTVAALAAGSRRVGRATLGTHARTGTPGADALRARLGEGLAHGHAAVVQGFLGAALGLGRAETEAAAFHAQIAGSASAAIRLGRLGALAAQEVHARAIAAVAPALEGPPPALPCAFAPLADIAAARRSARAGSLFAT